MAGVSVMPAGLQLKILYRIYSGWCHVRARPPRRIKLHQAPEIMGDYVQWLPVLYSSLIPLGFPCVELYRNRCSYEFKVMLCIQEQR